MYSFVPCRGFISRSQIKRLRFGPALLKYGITHRDHAFAIDFTRYVSACLFPMKSSRKSGVQSGVVTMVMMPKRQRCFGDGNRVEVDIKGSPTCFRADPRYAPRTPFNIVRERHPGRFTRSRSRRHVCEQEHAGLLDDTGFSAFSHLH